MSQGNPNHDKLGRFASAVGRGAVKAARFVAKAENIATAATVVAGAVLLGVRHVNRSNVLKAHIQNQMRPTGPKISPMKGFKSRGSGYTAADLAAHKKKFPSQWNSK